MKKRQSLFMERAPEWTFGALFLFSLAACSMAAPSSPSSVLARQLFEEANWQACHTECTRVLPHDPAHDETLLIKAICRLRMGQDAAGDLELLIADKTRDPETAHMARYELARLRWSEKRNAQAFELFTTVFRQSDSPALFLRAGCSLSKLSEGHEDLAKNSPALIPQLQSCAHLWTREIRNECRVDNPKTHREAFTGKPMLWTIAFYRSQIRPAIGSRCSLHPSCSEYAMRALGRHGLLGLALYGDRAVREPDVIKARQSPIRIDKRRLYQDPLSNHTWWWDTEGTSVQRSEFRKP